MSGFENWPAPILRRWLLSAAAGPVIFLIGLAGRIALHDPTLLTLSTLLASCIVVRCILLFQAIRQGAYETVEGVCVAIRRASLRGHQRIRLMDDSGTAHDLLLDRRQRFLIGSSYRIYLQSSSGAALPGARIPHGALLGLEDLGESRAESEIDCQAAAQEGSDIAAIGYLHAVQRYFTEKSLHRYRFSTIAWRSMNSSLNTFRRQEQRRQSHEFSYQAAHPPPDDAFDALQARLLLHDLFLLADEEQALLIRHRLHGCSLAETARREGMSVKRVRHRLKALYRTYFAQKETKQKEL